MRFKPPKFKGPDIPTGKQRFDPKDKRRTGTNVLVGEQLTEEECLVQTYREWFATEPEKHTSGYNFWKDAWTQLKSLAHKQYLSKVWYTWEEWYNEWEEDSCQPGVKLNLRTSERLQKEEVEREEGEYPMYWASGEEDPRQVSVGVKIPFGRPQSYPLTPSESTVEDSNDDPKPVGGPETYTPKAATTEPDDLGSWSPETYAFEGYGNDQVNYSDQSKPVPALARTGPWKGKSSPEVVQFKPMNIGDEFTGKELAALKAPYVGIRGNTSASDLNPSGSYVYLGARFYNYGGEFYNIQSQDGKVIEFPVTYGYYLALITPSRVYRGRKPQYQGFD